LELETRKQGLRERVVFFVIGRLKQLAMREWHAELRHWVIGWGLASLICVVVRPFETDGLGLVQAIAYWFGINAIATSLMFGILRGFRARMTDHFVQIALMGSAVFALLFSPILILVNQSLFDTSASIGVFISNFAIALLVFAIVWIAISWRPSQAETRVSTFQNRLTKHRNATLWAISAQDHYLDVQTDQGSELILMRLSDAIRELESFDGIQTHRSHWIARAGLDSIKGSNATLRNGAVIPISRANAKQVKTFFA